jgi:hypothetical protein
LTDRTRRAEVVLLFSLLFVLFVLLLDALGTTRRVLAASIDCCATTRTRMEK